MFRSKVFTVIGILSFLLIAASVALQIMELDAYEMVDPIINKIMGK